VALPSRPLSFCNPQPARDGARPRAHAAMIFTAAVFKRLCEAGLAIIFPASTAGFFIGQVS
jgi:hypothetical protein